MDQDYKSQYNKGNNQGYGNKSPYQGQQQPVPSQAPVQQLRIDFGMILPYKFGLEQFLEMTKALKHIEESTQSLITINTTDVSHPNRETTPTRRISSQTV